MPSRTFACPVCAGLKNIEIGDNLNDSRIGLIDCPGCAGKGYSHVIQHLYLPLSEPFYKRIMGLDIKGDNNEKPNQ